MSTIGALKPYDPTVDDIEVWLITFESFLTAKGLDKVKEESKCRAILLSTLGMQTVSLLVSLTAPDAPSSKPLDDLIKVLTTHFKPTPKAIAERFRFMGRRQKQGESIAQFLAELRTLASTCKFKTDLNVRLRDQFIFGLLNESTQRRLFTKDDDVELKTVVSIAQAQELCEISTSLVRASQQLQGEEEEVNKMTHSERKFTTSHQNEKRTSRGPPPKSNKLCPNCGSKSHTSFKECPHTDVECFNCGRKGHFRRMCRSPKTASSSQDKKRSSTSNVEVQIVRSNKKKKIWIQVSINSVPNTMEFDTGCEKSLLSQEFRKTHLHSSKLLPPASSYRTYTGETIPVIGDLSATIGYKSQLIQDSITVGTGSSLFGRDLISKFKIDWSEIAAQCNSVRSNSDETLNELLKEYSDIFSAPKGKIKGYKAKIIVKDDAIPKFLKARPIPYALLPKVDKELEEMDGSGVIERVDHSEWASPLVVVPKPDGRVRITGDFKNTVNSQLHITQYPIANPEKLFNSVAGGATFSKLDGTNAYHQIEVDEICKKFLVINTHKGLYRYNVLPQGIASSPAIFQEFADRLLQGIPMAGSYIDYVLSSAVNEQDHLRTLRDIFQRIRESNYFLSKDKCKFMQSHVEFLGHVLSRHGIHTSPKKIEAIEVIQKPNDITELRSFLGLVNFYGKFVNNFAELCEPLYRLTRENTKFQWSQQCQVAFEKVKKALSSSDVLVHFDPTLPIGISCDASSRGLGIVLFHEMKVNGKICERPIAYGSRILSQTEQRYSQIEKEGLSIMYGLSKFYKFLCGRKFKLITDHKPLLAIFGSKNNLQAYVAARLHRWSLYLSQFDYEIQYRKTNDHANADALSRVPMKNGPNSEEEEYNTNFIANEQFEVLPVTAQSIRNATARDKVLSVVMRYTQSGWPNQLIQDEEHIKRFFTHRNELTIEQGVLLWGIRVLIPSLLRTKILQQLHECHFGIVKMKSLARQFVWWPNIDRDIEQLGGSCNQCCESRPDPPSAPLHPWQYPERAWQRLHIDLAGPFYNKMWLVVMDAHSKWPEFFDLHTNSTSASVITKLREIFTIFGIPEQIVSENGTQFTSAEFKQFCKNNGIRHTTSSVYHPRSNGEAERLVQTFKKSLKATTGDLNYRLQSFLFHYRLSTHSTTGVAPCELLLGRKPRSRLDLIRPDVQVNVGHSQTRQVTGFNKRVKYRAFQDEEEVWVKTHSKNEVKWSLGTILKSLGPVTYLVLVGGKELKRHVDHIYPALKFQLKPSEPEPELVEPSPSTSTTSTAGSSPSPVHPSLTSDSSPEAVFQGQPKRVKRNVKPIKRLGLDFD